MTRSAAWVRAPLALLLVFVCACRTGQEDYSGKPELEDIRKGVDSLVGKLLGSPFIESVKSLPEKPGIAVDVIANETSHHIETTRILDSFETRIVNTRLFVVSSRENREKFIDLVVKQGGDWFDSRTAPAVGMQFGFRYIIGGRLHGQLDRKREEARTQYTLLIKVMDIQSGTIEWQGEHHFTKFQR